MRTDAWKSKETRERLRACEPWPFYYEFRSAEIGVAKSHCALPSSGVLLEIGCGNAFQAYLLSEGFSMAVGTDLLASDPETHTPGLGNAARLRDVLGFDELRLAASAAERVPLAAGAVDFVFSSNVLEHVQDQRNAVAEIWRVLKPGGRALVIVPSAMERVYNLPVSYVAVLRSALRGVRAHRTERSTTGGGPPQRPGGASGTGLWARATRFLSVHYPSFPFPKPHGNYPTSTAEFLAHLPIRWERVFRAQGFRIERTFTTILAPHTLGLAFSERLAYAIAWLGWPATRVLGGLPVIKWLGTSYALLVSKSG